MRNFNCYIGRKVTAEMIQQAVDIDNCVYSNGFQGVYETCVKWWGKNPLIYIMLEDKETHNIVGYINVMPISDTCYHKIRNGEIIDTDICLEDIETYDFRGTYNLYFSSIAIHPDYHNTNAFKNLVDGFITHIQQLSKRGINFSSIIVDAVSDAGEKLCEHIRLNYILTSNHNSKIYEGNLCDLISILTSKRFG